MAAPAFHYSFESTVFGSAVSGIISRCVTHPLDTIKAKVQAHQHYAGPIDALKRTYSSGGIRGLYRGIGVVIVGGTPGTIVYLCSYEACKEKLGNDSSVSYFCSGFVAETLACIIYVPVDVLKERLQVQRGPSAQHYANGWQGLNHIVRSEGIRGVYRGYGATLASFAPFSALYFVFYEECKRVARLHLQGTGDEARFDAKLDLPFHWTVLCSTAAGILSSWITSPLDMAKLRLQVQRGMSPEDNPRAYVYNGFIDCLRQTYAHEGLRGLFRGAGARVLHFAPATTIAMTCFESCRSFYESMIAGTI